MWSTSDIARALIDARYTAHGTLVLKSYGQRAFLMTFRIDGPGTLLIATHLGVDGICMLDWDDGSGPDRIDPEDLGPDLTLTIGSLCNHIADPRE